MYGACVTICERTDETCDPGGRAVPWCDVMGDGWEKQVSIFEGLLRVFFSRTRIYCVGKVSDDSPGGEVEFWMVPDDCG